ISLQPETSNYGKLVISIDPGPENHSCTLHNSDNLETEIIESLVQGKLAGSFTVKRTQEYLNLTVRFHQ
ncbi:MAG: hypothetical protein ACLFR1_14570, partial [Spirochaetia bacterium]